MLVTIVVGLKRIFPVNGTRFVFIVDGFSSTIDD